MANSIDNYLGVHAQALLPSTSVVAFELARAAKEKFGGDAVGDPAV